ncbi:hypothetical protein [Kocuria salsicia]|uniref:Major facilitator superfamily (MFS) profile domain-containing protein n=1 Tax=Kocuria salsicia TaxID=664639 RepID=A0ABV3KI62_9MICC
MDARPSPPGPRPAASRARTPLSAGAFVAILGAAGILLGATTSIFPMLLTGIGLLGQGLLAAALLLTGFGAEHHGLVLTALVLLGLGWSASTVSRTTMVTETVQTQERPALQGTSDLAMNLCGGGGRSPRWPGALPGGGSRGWAPWRSTSSPSS